MKVKTILIMALMAVPGAVAAQNSLTVAETSIPQNGGELKFNFTFAVENVYTSYQFKIVTPEGAVYDTDTDGDVACTLGACHTTSHACTAHWNSATRTLGVGVASMSSALLKGTSGELISIPLLGTENAVGTTLTFSVEDINFIRQDGTKDKLDDLEVIITVAAPADKRTLLDENSTTAPVAATDVNVRVKRTINANEWSTLVLPFAMTEAQVKAAFGDDVQIADFTGYDSTYDDADNVTALTVSFDNVTAIEANHPYIIKVGEAVTEFTVDGVTIEPEDVPCVALGNTTGRGQSAVYHPMDFTGTYIADFDFYNDAQSRALFLSGNKFWYATESTQHMKAFRGYFDFDDILSEVDNAASRIVMLFSGDNMTGITNICGEAGDGLYYNLQGLPVEAPARGMYIRNGKVVIVKQ